MDVDGTLTDGKIYMGSDGELMKAFDVRDGYAIVIISSIAPSSGGFLSPVFFTNVTNGTVPVRKIWDGYAIAHMLPKMHITPVIITGRRSRITENRACELGITALFQGVADKPQALREVVRQFGCGCENVAYIGDDLNDLACMALCGLTACPADAAQPVRQAADYVCRAKGGCGAVREWIEYIGDEYEADN